MNKQRELGMKAKTLRTLLERYSESVPEANACLKELRGVLERAEQNSLAIPVGSVPCSYVFHEGELRKFRDLEEAYSEFSVIAKGYDMDGFRQFIDDVDSGEYKG